LYAFKEYPELDQHCLAVLTLLADWHEEFQTLFLDMTNTCSAHPSYTRSERIDPKYRLQISGLGGAGGLSRSHERMVVGVDACGRVGRGMSWVIIGLLLMSMTPACGSQTSSRRGTELVLPIAVQYDDAVYTSHGCRAYADNNLRMEAELQGSFERA
jgi:hypothetical protein